MDLQTLLRGFLSFLNGTVAPFLLVLATLFFVWNGVRFFIFGRGSEESQEKARSFMLWSILAFVVIASLWGIINLIGGSIGLLEKDQVTPDYMNR